MCVCVCLYAWRRGGEGGKGMFLGQGGGKLLIERMNRVSYLTNSYVRMKGRQEELEVQSEYNAATPPTHTHTHTHTLLASDLSVTTSA